MAMAWAQAIESSTDDRRWEEFSARYRLMAATVKSESGQPPAASPPAKVRRPSSAMS